MSCSLAMVVVCADDLLTQQSSSEQVEVILLTGWYIITYESVRSKRRCSYMILSTKA